MEIRPLICQDNLRTNSWPSVWETADHLAVAGDVFDVVFLCCPFSPLDILDVIWDLIESVSEGFLIYSSRFGFMSVFLRQEYGNI